jgi:type IV pilus assembly protein PilB
VAAQTKAQAAHKDVAEVLAQEGKLTAELIAKLKAEAAGLVYMEVLDYQVDPKVLELVPETVARKHTLLPLYRIGNALTVAMDDPWNTVAIDEVRLSAKLPVIQPVLGSPSAIRKAIDRHYGRKVVEEAARRPAAPNGAPPEAERPPTAGAAPVEVASEVPVAKLVDALLTEALEAKASDIHLEPEEQSLRVRYRIDGVLHEVKQLPADLHEGVCSRIKLLAKLDITEHRLPQDGHLPLTIDGRLIDLRISTYPTVFGENVVIRLLDHESLRLSLEALGFAPENLKQFAELIQRPHGMILVTGPTGSGKTTSLYAALSCINSVAKNIMTIEDPVEYRLPLIRQTQVNLKAGVTFAAGLRSLLRQDPDVIMVGEIRDQETAEIAVHAALTGHLVLSTLHTNDAVGAVARLVDMGVEPYLLSSTLLGIVAQRLLRRICTHCRQEQPFPAEAKERHPNLTALFRGRGCRFCRQAGFSGRIGVFELFRIDEQAKAAIAARRPSDELKRLALSGGMRTMRDDGMLKVQQGLTTLDELDRVVPVEL